MADNFIRHGVYPIPGAVFATFAVPWTLLIKLISLPYRTVRAVPVPAHMRTHYICTLVRERTEAAHP